MKVRIINQKDILYNCVVNVIKKDSAITIIKGPDEKDLAYMTTEVEEIKE